MDGELSPSDAHQIAAALASESPSNAYTYLHALGHARATALEAFVRPFLRRADDPLLSRMALQVLCTYWGLHENYRQDIAAFLEGVDWDVSQGRYVQLAAASIAGDVVRESNDRQLGERLARMVLDDGNPVVVRDAAYVALLVAEGIPYDQLPAASRLHGPNTYDWAVVRRYVLASDA